MLRKSIFALAGALSLAAAVPAATTTSLNLQAACTLKPSSQPSCRCIPGDSCWPSQTIWNVFNQTVSGRLVASTPIAAPCYPGPQQNAAQCASIDSEWSNAYFQESIPLGLSYPTNITCPPVNATAGQTPGSCTLGNNPVYSVNATTTEQVAATVLMAELFNIRLVIKNTGHDILGRSEGADGLEVWLHNYRNGINYQSKFKSATGCMASNWIGAAIQINGGYVWGDVYAVAKANNVVVVGGGTPSVGATGGWMSGGGHGPASRQFGLGADQVVEAQVLLWNGTVVTANACQNQDLFFAIRGGGGGTYGITLSTTVKAYPNFSVQVQHLAIAPLTSNYSTLLDAVTVLFGAYPDLNDAGYAGYGTWTLASPTPLFASFYSGYVHGIYMFGKTQAQAQASFTSTRQKLAAYNSSLVISETYVNYTDYWSFYSTESGVEPSVGVTSALGSRLFARDDVSDFSSLRNMVGVIAGDPSEYTSNNFEIVSGGAVFTNTDPYSGLLPAWRKSYFNNIVARGWAPGTPAATQNAIYDDITNNKVAAMKKQAPDTGVYMNEGDRHDAQYIIDFYGSNYAKFLSIKQKYDPLGTFYCPTCVGSSAYTVDSNTGRLCKASS